MRRRTSILFALMLVLAVPLVAWARSAETSLPGQKVFGELGSNDRVTVLVDCVAGTTFGAKCVAYRGTTPRLDLSLADPDGTPISLAAVKTANEKQTVVSIKKLALTRTGAYRLTVSTAVGTPGGFDLTITGAAPASVAGTGTIDAPDAVVSVPFEALPGDKVKCVVHPAKGSKLKPFIHRFVDAGGAETLIDAAKQKTPVVAATLGTSSFEITGAPATVGGPGTTGGFTWKLSIVRAKAPKGKRDAAELNAAGTIFGVVVVDGQSTHPAGARIEKAARRSSAPDVRPGEIVVAAPDAKSFAEVEAAACAAMPGARCSVAAALSDHGPYLVRVEHLFGVAGARAKSATRALAKSAAAARTFEWTEPNAVVTAYEEPNDPRYPEQFHLRYLRLPNVWNQTEGDPSVVIAVVDTGSMPHPELLSQYVPGYDFISDPATSLDGDGWDADPTDAALELHGTHVAGIIGAKANNKTGVAGVVWGTSLLPVRVLGKDGGSFFDVAAGLRWAVGLSVPNAPPNPTPARVVNMSLGAHYDSSVMRSAVAEIVANKPNVVLVAAAGNEGTNDPSYPAAYPGVISVYALDANLLWASYSNYGTWISVGAPGGDPYRGQAGILSTYWDTAANKGSYEELSGTSMASPQVAGVAALLIALKPSITGAEVKDALEKTALDLGDVGFDTDFGWGMVNAEAAAEFVLTPFAPPSAIDVAPTSLSFDGVAVQAQVFVRTKTTTPVTISQIDVTMDQAPAAGWLTAVTDHAVTPATITVAIDPALDAGTYSGKIRLTTSVGVVDVPVRAVRAPKPNLNLVIVSAVDVDGKVVAQTTTNAAKNWAYSLPDVPIGRYRIKALADQNADLILDRVDEWEGEWPLLTQPDFVDLSADSLDRESVNLPLSRYDARFSYAGVGAGHITGAFAVRAVDASTDRPVSSENVHVGGGAPVTVGDARGRGVVTGAFTGAQAVTVAADGYGPTSRVGSDAQYQSFPLTPQTAAATTVVTATVRGLSASDHDVYLQVGDAKGHVVYAGGADPAFTLTVTNTVDPVPVSASTFDASGGATRHAVYELDVLAPTFDVQLTALPVGGAQARFVQPTAPTSNFTVAGATVNSAVYVRWNDDTWLDVGESPLTFGQNKQGWWADPGVFTPPLAMKFETVATDATGRTSRKIVYGDTTNLQTPSGATALDPPTSLTTPANGATGVALAPTLTWNGGVAAHLHKVVVEQVGTPWRWTLWVAGALNSTQLPAISKGGLASATNYRWSVETFRFASGFDASLYRDEKIDTTCTSRTFSGWATFKTQ
jgi:serine protease